MLSIQYLVALLARNLFAHLLAHPLGHLLAVLPGHGLAGVDRFLCGKLAADLLGDAGAPPAPAVSGTPFAVANVPTGANLAREGAYCTVQLRLSLGVSIFKQQICRQFFF